MHILDVYRVQADMVLEFMESKGIKKEALYTIVASPFWSAPRSPHISQRVYGQAAAEHRAKVSKLYKDGVKQTEIARMTGRSQSGIAMLLKRERDKGNLEKRAYDARKVSDEEKE